jgi:hypothetical protein
MAAPKQAKNVPAQLGKKAPRRRKRRFGGGERIILRSALIPDFTGQVMASAG